METLSAPHLDSDFQFFNPKENREDSTKKDFSTKKERLTPREKTFYARLGVAALTAAMLATSAKAVKTHPPKPQSVAIDTVNLPTKITSLMDEIAESDPVTPEELVVLPTESDTDEKLAIPPNDLVFASEEDLNELKTDWQGPVLNPHDGHIEGPTGDETYYDLPMDEIVARMHRMGVKGDYWEREDGVKMLGKYVMVAANLSVHPRGSIVETSLGPGIVCDTGGFAKEHPYRLDIATNWVEKAQK